MRSKKIRHYLISFMVLGLTTHVTSQCNVNIVTSMVWCAGECNGSAFAQPYGLPPYTFEWSTGATTEGIEDLCPGTYDLTIIDDLGCVATETFTIIEPLPIQVTATLVSGPSIPGACDAVVEMTVSGGTSPYQYIWNDCLSNGTGWFGTPDWLGCEGEWSFSALDANGCTDTSACILIQAVNVSISDRPEQLPEYQLDGRSLRIDGPISDLQVRDALGRIRSVSAGQGRMVDLHMLPNGLYVVSWKGSNDHYEVLKLVLN